MDVGQTSDSDVDSDMIDKLIDLVSSADDTDEGYTNGDVEQIANDQIQKLKDQHTDAINKMKADYEAKLEHVVSKNKYANSLFKYGREFVNS